jgi:hypothetical protein
MTRPRRRARLAVLQIIAVIGVLGLVREIGHSQERDWRSKHFNRFGEACCDDSDCREIPVDVALRLKVGDIAQVGDLGHALVNAIYPTEDERSWLCTTGCLFRPFLN